jgi:hypothetical protein
MSIPEWIQKKLKDAGEKAGQVGVELAIEFLKEARLLVHGAYFMPPFKKYQMAVDVLEKI